MYVSVLLLSVAFACAARQAPLLRLRDGRRMPALALGTWLGHAYTSQLQPASDEVERAVSWALQAGYRHVDTAARYQVEGQLGRALAAAALPREQLFVTTKLWNDAHAQDAVAPALRASLTRLGLDYVDLYLMHWPVGQFANLTYDYTDYLETWRGMAAAQRQGLARSIGVSNFNQDMMERIREHGLPTPAVLQVEINLNLQQPSLLSYCRAHNITVMGYTPFGSLFPNKAAPHAPPPRVDDPALVAMATKYNKTVPQVVLRYLVELGVAPIPKSVTKTRIEQNIDVFDFSLSESDKGLLRGYDRGYRTIPQLKWLDHPYYPFEKNHTIGKTR
ncbi:aldo-keto reductase AKR2E4-like [Choristoneura fumiferana]|uniref:aldo-keto reductase AKR2E4-like n=1 Tax=Choristoneura fumiferana TaxID=7141 RepID=UPI003D157F35